MKAAVAFIGARPAGGRPRSPTRTPVALPEAAATSQVDHEKGRTTTSGSGLRRAAARRLTAALIAIAGCACGVREKGGTALRWVTWKPEAPEVWDEAVRRFEAANPGVSVERQIAPHSSTAFHDLLTQ